MRLSSLLLLAVFAATPHRPAFVVPNFRDLKLKVRVTQGLGSTSVTAWYFRGPRERSDHFLAMSLRHDSAPMTSMILQCDLKTQILLRTPLKTYTTFTNTWGEVQEDHRKHPRPMPQPTGPEVLVTTDGVDTGDRRQVGGYEAHHIKTTVKVGPGEGAQTKPRKVEIDGWYLEVPGLNCREDDTDSAAPPTMGWPVFGLGGHGDHMVFKRTGAIARGITIEETLTAKGEGNTIVRKTELVESSDAPLDESLFEVPPDYSLATPTNQHELRPVPFSQ